jgi:hypothetical protein
LEIVFSLMMSLLLKWSALSLISSGMRFENI